MKSTLKSLLLATTTATLMTSTAAMAYEAGDILVKGGAAMVAPNDKSSDVTGLTGGLAVKNETQVGLTLTYMYSDKVGVELLAATPFTHDLVATNGIAAVGKAADTKHLPPTVTVNYYLADANSKVQPYVGAGINYTRFFDEEASASLNTALGGSTTVDLDDSWGLALHAGVDYQLDQNWAVNAGVWYIDIDTTGTLNTSGTVRTVDVDIDPMVYMVGVSYKF